MVSGARERRLSLRARELKTAGREALGALPSRDELAEQSDQDRHRVLEVLRTELYAISSILADATVERARRHRPSYPPYGLVRSMHTETRLVVASPETVAEGSLDSFHALGKAYVDTMVFHLDRHLGEQRQSDEAWMLDRLEELLARFRIGAGPATRSRMRDGLSFLYGGLHFGTGVCVQLAEVMSRLLAPHPGLGPQEKAAVLTRSIRPAYRLAALNIDHVVLAYQSLQSPALPGATVTWMKDERFVVHQTDGTPSRIDLVGEETLGPRGRPLADVPTTYETQGCPARVSPTGGSPPIAGLWTWCVELAHEAGLLGPRDG